MERFLEPEQARLYELIWGALTLASQMESAELERTTVDIAALVGLATDKPRHLDLRASGQVVKFDGFLRLYQEGKDDEGEDEDSRRLPPMAAGDPLSKRKIEATQHFTEPPPRYSEASLVKRMEELGIGPAVHLRLDAGGAEGPRICAAGQKRLYARTRACW